MEEFHDASLLIRDVAFGFAGLWADTPNWHQFIRLQTQLQGNWHDQQQVMALTVLAIVGGGAC